MNCLLLRSTKEKSQLKNQIGRGADMNVLLMDAQTKSSKGECALSMGQMSNYAATRDAQTNLSREECAVGMEQGANFAAPMDAQTEL